MAMNITLTIRRMTMEIIGTTAVTKAIEITMKKMTMMPKKMTILITMTRNK